MNNTTANKLKIHELELPFVLFILVVLFMSFPSLAKATQRKNKVLTFFIGRIPTILLKILRKLAVPSHCPIRSVKLTTETYTPISPRPSPSPPYPGENKPIFAGNAAMASHARRDATPFNASGAPEAFHPRGGGVRGLARKRISGRIATSSRNPGFD